LLAGRLEHEHPTDTDTKNTYELAVKIAHGWARLVNGSYFLLYSAPYSEAAASIVSGMGDRDLERVQLLVSSRWSSSARDCPRGRRRSSRVDSPARATRSSSPMRCPAAAMSPPLNGRPVKGHSDRWSVDVVLSDPRDG